MSDFNSESRLISNREYDQLQAECERKDKVLAELKECEFAWEQTRRENEALKRRLETYEEIESNRELLDKQFIKFRDGFELAQSQLTAKDAQLAKYKAALEFAERRIDQIHSWSGAKDEATAIRKIEELATKYLKHERAALAEGDGSK